MPTSTTTELTLLGKPLKRTEGGVLTMTRKDYHDVLASLGVTPEVRSTISAAELKVASEALTLLNANMQSFAEEHRARIAEAKTAVASGKATTSQRRLAESDPNAPVAEIVLGSGDGRTTIAIAAKDEYKGINPRTGEPVHTVKHGVVTYETRRTLPSELDPLLKKIEDDCAKAFGVKK